MTTTEQYLDRIAPEHADKPKFVATVALTVDVLARLQVFLASIPQAFDLDEAIGVQLDAVGVRVGRSRRLSIPLQGLFFTLGDPLRGFGSGIWKGPYDTGLGVYALDDETYRRLLRAKILANSWDGTVEGEQAILDAYFIDPDTYVFVQDGGFAASPEGWFTLGDPRRGFGQGSWHPKGTPLSGLGAATMVMTIGVSGKIPPLLDLSLLGQGLIAAKPGGVKLNYAVTSKRGAPLFGLGVQNEYIAGFGTGAWAVTPSYAATHTIS